MAASPAFSGPKKGKIATQPLHSRGAAAKGAKSEVATSPLLSAGPKRGWNCYATPAFSRVPNARRGEKIGTSCLTPAFSGGQKREEVLRNPCILEGSPRPSAGTKSEVATSPLPFRGPKEGGIAT